MITIIKPLLVNITILFSFTFNANIFFPFQPKNPNSIKSQLYYGFIGALGALFCMVYPIETLGETHFDLRMIAIMIVTLYSGWLSGAIVLTCVTIIRALIGGQFVIIGITVGILAFLVTILLRQLFIKSNAKITIGTVIALIYFSVYILLLFLTVDILNFSFYVLYFTAFLFTYIALIFIIEKLKAINKQIDEMVYLDKLHTVGQLTASIAHEIRNPLTTVRGFIQFLSMETKDNQLKKYSPLILEELDRTNSIITNYLTVAKPQAFTTTKVGLHEVLKDCVQLLRPLASYSNVMLEFSPTEVIYISGDKQYLKQALMNVIKNGIEAIPNGGIVKITSNVDYLRNTVDIQIEDTGRGMSPEHLKHIGLPFYTTKTKGTGLGSMVTNKVIREMNGKIEYESEQNIGTIVKITFPIIKR